MASAQAKRFGTHVARDMWAVSVIVGMVLAMAVPARANEMVLRTYSKAAAFEDVRFDLQNAIIKRGLTIDFNGQIGKMLDRTGADVGSSKPIYRQAEYFSFCSAVLSRRAMEVDPINLGFCPFVVFIYEPSGSPGTVHVGFRRPERRGSEASVAALTEIEQLLDGIVQESIQ